MCIRDSCRIAGEERCQFGATQHSAHLLPASITPSDEVILSGRFPWWLPQGLDHNFLLQPMGPSYLERQLLSSQDGGSSIYPHPALEVGLSGLCCPAVGYKQSSLLISRWEKSEQLLGWCPCQLASGSMREKASSHHRWEIRWASLGSPHSLSA